MKKALRIIKSVILTILAVVVILVCWLCVSPLFIKHDSLKVEGSRSWMSAIADETIISDISIPGTHDSASNNVVLPYFAKCQASDIRTQLDEGFRYLDIRLGVKRVQNEDRLLLFHGFCRCKESWVPWAKDLDLGSVLAQCYSFLSDYPTETIIFVVKMEQKSDLRSFQLLLDSYISQGKDKWLLTDELPTMGECRGRIVLFRRYEDVCGLGQRAGIYMDWPDQVGNSDVSLNTEEIEHESFTLLVQDRYKYGIEDKWKAFEAGLSSPGPECDLVRLSFLSTNGTPKFGHPYSYASSLNKRLLDADLSVCLKNWIIVDFSDAKLAQHIYSMNKTAR